MSAPDPSPVSEQNNLLPIAPDGGGVLPTWLTTQRVFHSTEGTILVIRWVTLFLLLMLSLIESESGWAGLPPWVLVLAFVGYALVTDVLRHRWCWYRSRPRLVFLDLAVGGGLYLLSSDYRSPLYILIYVTLVSGTATLSPKGALIYMVATIAVVTAAELTLRQGDGLKPIIVDTGGRIIILAMIAFAVVILMRRLAFQEATTRAVRLEAERMAELDRLRTGFVSSVSHDLQTPLTSVRAGLGLLELSLADRLKTDEHQLLTNARRNVDRLGLQINDLLTLNQLEAGALLLDPIPFDLRATITDVIALIHPLLRQKEQTLEIDVSDPLMVNGDPRRLDQVVTNLLVNAHRHTPTGTRITISARAIPEEVLLSVSDDGPGIPPEDRDRIFERFHRLQPTGDGSGLGLAIVKAIVDLHHGRIWVESNGARGASFQVALPRIEDGVF